MPAGRPRKPKALKDLQGNAGKRKVKPVTPADNTGTRFGTPHGCPTVIRNRVNPFARKLEAAGVDVETYRTKWDAFVKHLMVCHDAEKELKAGAVVTDRFGAVKPNPAAQIHSTHSKIARGIENDFLKLLERLGPKENKNPFEGRILKAVK